MKNLIVHKRLPGLDQIVLSFRNNPPSRMTVQVTLFLCSLHFFHPVVNWSEPESSLAARTKHARPFLWTWTNSIYSNEFLVAPQSHTFFSPNCIFSRCSNDFEWILFFIFCAVFFCGGLQPAAAIDPHTSLLNSRSVFFPFSPLLPVQIDWFLAFLCDCVACGWASWKSFILTPCYVTLYTARRKLTSSQKLIMVQICLSSVRGQFRSPCRLKLAFFKSSFFNMHRWEVVGHVNERLSRH